jgi:hypothetical protein
MTVLFDENFSHHLIELMARCGAPGDLQHTRKVGWNGKPDSEWIQLAARNGWVICSADRNDRTRQLTVADLKRMGVRLVLIGAFWDHLGIWEKTCWLVSHWTGLNDRIHAIQTGSCLLVDRSGACTEV